MISKAEAYMANLINKGYYSHDTEMDYSLNEIVPPQVLNFSMKNPFSPDLE